MSEDSRQAKAEEAVSAMSPQQRANLYQELVSQNFEESKQAAVRTTDLLAVDSFINDNATDSSDLNPAVGMLLAISSTLNVGLSSQARAEEAAYTEDTRYPQELSEAMSILSTEILEAAQVLHTLHAHYAAALSFRKVEMFILDDQGSTKPYPVKQKDINKLEQLFAKSESLVTGDKTDASS
ncbi:hypothetical protein SynBIOSE41_00859 [Synechococcus sp. BIOS-E4-1]|uniref:hypothetical protein n=1 Tax=Synechococcus sp. BIOS-E4-1 TaxID=1400864 RepID=UPI001644A044|nr:hypothetical protein [Synechococcus sp. BIOS-E4-1]QNI53391.1 hypothetical protein SynBIOSE41_00859 [Synechococcus sp. BIOS-E4-1]